MAVMKGNEVSNFEKHEELLRSLKQQVKAIMEESVTKKFVHEESAHVLRLCGTIEVCLLDGLKRRVPGFLRSNKIASLFTKIGKNLPAVRDLVLRIEDVESSMTNSTNGTNVNNGNSCKRKYFWVRMALTEKLLDQILQFLVKNHRKFYEESSIMSNSVYGEIIAVLLVGPCALDFTKMKTHDHYWSDPPADELIQRHRLHSRRINHHRSPTRRPALTSNSNKTSVTSPGSEHTSAEKSSAFRDYVESLHQNSRMTLLFGKNNVVVQPREDIGHIPGYLSLHQEGSSLVMKWTPNQLMQGDYDPEVVDENSANNESSEYSSSSTDTTGSDEKRSSSYQPGRGAFEEPIDQDNKHHQRQLSNHSRKPPNYFTHGKSPRRRRSSRSPCCSLSYWTFAVSVDIRDVVYLHCHQQEDKSGELVLVGQDGVQWPPVRFPPGNHLLAFLSCLETGLLPHGCLDPPLWSQKGKGAVFPQLRKRVDGKKSSSDKNNVASTGVVAANNGDGASDFVFRVSFSSDSSELRHHASSSPPRVVENSNFLQSFAQLLENSLQGGDQDKLDSGERSGFQRTVVMSDLLKGHRSFRVHRQPDEKRRRMRSNKGDSSEPFVPTPYMYAWKSEERSYLSRNEINQSNTELSVTASRTSLKVLCEAMRRQIISRAFYGWFAHCRHLATVRKHLSTLVKREDAATTTKDLKEIRQVDDEVWSEKLMIDGKLSSMDDLARHVYNRGTKHHLRALVWPYLLGHYPPDSDPQQRDEIDQISHQHYISTLAECGAVESLLIQQRGPRTSSTSSSACSRLSSTGNTVVRESHTYLQRQASYMSDVFVSETDSRKQSNDRIFSAQSSTSKQNGSVVTDTQERRVHFNHRERKMARPSDESHVPYSSVSTQASGNDHRMSLSLKSFSVEERDEVDDDDEDDDDEEEEDKKDEDDKQEEEEEKENEEKEADNSDNEDKETSNEKEIVEEKKSAAINDDCEVESRKIEDLENGHNFSAAEEEVEESEIVDTIEDETLEENNVGGGYTKKILDLFELNLHRIDKDVQRCDRNHEYFSKAKNLEKLRNIMSSYVWRHLDVGYMQGMCDLAAPLLIIFDHESIVYSLFVKLMERMENNFPRSNGSDEKSAGGTISAMDQHLARLRQLLQILDVELYEHMLNKSDCTHFHFCYRWFLLDFKRELSYNGDIFAVWECIWAARYIASDQFVAFFALALLQAYRDIVIENDMDFTDIIKFFNEMAETHDAGEILTRARNLVAELQQMITK